MHKHFGFAWQSPHESATIRCWIFDWRPYSDVRFVNMACSLINNGDEQFYESVDLIPIVIDVTDFETIIQKYVGCLKTIMIL